MPLWAYFWRISGVFLLVASQYQLAHKSLIWFTVCSSAVHAGIMAVQSLSDVSERGHLVGDVRFLFLVGVVPGILFWIFLYGGLEKHRKAFE
jgi:hypothetical protein